MMFLWKYDCEKCGYKWICYGSKYSQDECQKCGAYVWPKKETEH